MKSHSPTLAETKPVITCPYCSSAQIIKKGQRRKKYERIQLYYCQRCQRKFTPLINKHYSYPLRVILDAITLYNRFYSMQEVAHIVSGSYGIAVRRQTVAKWLKDFKGYLPILKTRGALMAGYDTRKAFIESRLLHGQVYDFKCHYAKLDHLLHRHSPNGIFRNLQDFLKDVPSTCPHDLFRKMAKTKNRSSQHQDIFSLDEVKISLRPASSAIKNAHFVLQAVSNNKLRHQRVQDFMLTNDSATVAVEVPVILTEKDLDCFRRQLNFTVPIDWKISQAITGNIDRNMKFSLEQKQPPKQ